MTARILTPSPESLAEAARRLCNDEVVGMPTETVYGLAGHALSPLALSRIFATKERPTFDPLIVHVARELATLEQLANAGLIDIASLTPAARESAARLIAAFWPGPLTLVLPKTARVPDLATSGLDTVAIRMPAHPVAQQLLKEAGFPLAAPSANRFGRISPTSAQAVAEELGDRIELILDGGRCKIGVESTVLALAADGALILLRPGGAPLERLAEAAGRSARAGTDGEKVEFANAGAQAQLAPGMLASHYAPRTPLVLLPNALAALPERAVASGSAPAARVGLLALAGRADDARHALARALGRAESGAPAHGAGAPGGPGEIRACVLSPGGDLGEAARNLFAMLRELDSAGLAVIYAEPCLVREGLGFAIQDRLKRASQRSET